MGGYTEQVQVQEPDIGHQYPMWMAANPTSHLPTSHVKLSYRNRVLQQEWVNQHSDIEAKQAGVYILWPCVYGRKMHRCVVLHADLFLPLSAHNSVYRSGVDVPTDGRTFGARGKLRGPDRRTGESHHCYWNYGKPRLFRQSACIVYMKMTVLAFFFYLWV